ncbi:MAG: UDP-3-O-acyl-N-acetylglucosamine deacetylase, partial [Gemmatimonadota bacterium]|nr:UDP-3-O-acyl-N-acetylglucosamine deacetylase [Gemmatimonadota bacterium]
MQTATRRTLAAPADVGGLGLHSGRAVTARFLPAAPGTGITVRRTDVDGDAVRAVTDHVRSTDR